MEHEVEAKADELRALATAFNAEGIHPVCATRLVDAAEALEGRSRPVTYVSTRPDGWPTGFWLTLERAKKAAEGWPLNRHGREWKKAEVKDEDTAEHLGIVGMHELWADGRLAGQVIEVLPKE